MLRNTESVSTTFVKIIPTSKMQTISQPTINALQIRPKQTRIAAGNNRNLAAQIYALEHVIGS